MADEPLEKLPHRLSKNFSSSVATGHIVAGPGPNDLHTIMFFVDSWGIEAEQLTPIEGKEGSYTIEISEADCGYFREDVARVMLRREELTRLRDALTKHLDKTAKEDAQ